MPLRLSELPTPHALRTIALGVALGVTMLGSASVQAFDLSTAARQALQYDAAFLSAQKKAQADATLSAQGIGRLLPAARASAGFRKTDFDVSGFSGSPDPEFSNKKSNSYGLTLTQPLFRLDTYAAYNQDQERAKAGEANFSQARSDALLRVTQAYFDVLIAQDNLSSVDAELKAIGEQLESAKRNFEVGTATITDQQEAQARFDLATAKQIAAQNDLNVKRDALSQLVGQPMPVRFLGLQENVVLRSPEPLDVARWVDQARNANFRVRAAEATARIAKHEVTRVVAAENLPSVDLVASLNRADPYRGSPGSRGDYSDTTTIGIEITLPLFNGGIAVNRAREVMALKDKALFDLESERRSAEQNARTAFLGVLSGMSQVKAFEAAERSSKLALESNLLGYEVGVRINIDVLNAQQQLFATQRDLSKARYDTLINSLKLKSLVGTLTESDVDLVNALLAK
jgi:outer membrane protein